MKLPCKTYVLNIIRKFVAPEAATPGVGGMGIRGVWLAIALTDAILVVITISMMISEFRKMPSTVMAKR